MELLFLKAALVVYFISALGYMCSLYVKRVMAAKVSTWILFAAFVFHTVFFALRYSKTGQTPVVSLHETLSFFAWAIARSYLLFQVRTKTVKPLLQWGKSTEHTNEARLRVAEV